MKNYTIEVKWGIIFILAGLLWVIFEKAMGWHDENIEKLAIYTNLFGIIAVGIYILALREKRNKYFNGLMTWREGFISGIVLTIVITVLSPLSQYITSTYISSEYFSNIIAYSIENNKMSREDAEAYFNMRSYIIQTVFFALVMGVVTSAVVAWFLRTKKEK